MKSVALHTEAQAELDEAIGYYESRRAGLGLDLLTEVQEALERVRQNPLLCPRYRETPYRKCVLSRFRYIVFYRELEDVIWVAAVAHTSRKPGYWMHRTPEE